MKRKGAFSHKSKTSAPYGRSRAKNFLATGSKVLNAALTAKRLFKRIKTKTKKEPKKAQIVASDTIKVSRFKLKGKPLSKRNATLFQASYKNRYEFTGAFSGTTSQGVATDPSKQYITAINSFMAGVAYTGTHVPQCFQLNATTTGLAPSASNGNFAVLTRSAKWTLEFTNMAPSSAIVTFYLVKAKKSTGTGTITPVTYWETAIDAESGVLGSGTLTSTFPFNTPRTVTAFKDAWSIVHTLETTLNPGECQRHIINAPALNIVKNYQKYVNNQGWVANNTYYLFFTQRGTPADTSNTTAIGTVEFAPSKIVGVFGYELTTAVSPTRQVNTTQTTTLPGVGVANLYSMNDDSGGNVNVNTVNYG